MVKSKYYLSPFHFESTKDRFGKKYGIGVPDPYISEMFREDEEMLFCSYYEIKSAVHIEPIYITQPSAKSVNIKIYPVDSKIVDRFNSIFCEDGNKILFCNKEDLDRAFALKHTFRDVVVHF